MADVPRIDANAFRDGVLHFNGELEALLASFGYPPAFGSPPPRSISQFGTSMAIVAYIVVCALISFVSAAALRDRTRADFEEEEEERVPAAATARARAT